MSSHMAIQDLFPKKCGLCALPCHTEGRVPIGPVVHLHGLRSLPPMTQP